MNRLGCSYCGGDAVYLDRATGEHLCEPHLAQRVENSVRRAIGASGGFFEGERIAVAFSGGKDSSVLLHLLATVFRPETGIDLIAITIDEGITGYREETVRAAKELAVRLNVPHRVVSFNAAFGRDLDTLLAGREGRACTVCGVLRRRLLQQAAREAGADRLATGHCLDDEAEAVVMNWLRGDLHRVAGFRPEGGEGWMVPRFKPLSQLSEKEVVSYALLCDLAFDLPECPYTRYALRAGVRGLVHRAEFLAPGTMSRIVAGQEELEKRVHRLPASAHFSTCPDCGEPMLGPTCRACTLLRLDQDNH
ncbi:MAG: TIGR00269 family protein [Methanoregulaceae archaeon]